MKREAVTGGAGDDGLLAALCPAVHGLTFSRNQVGGSAGLDTQGKAAGGMGPVLERSNQLRPCHRLPIPVEWRIQARGASPIR